MTTELYFSIDVETDGPVPSPYSMISIGICVAGSRAEGEPFVPIDPDKYTYYAELMPMSDTYDPEAFAVSGFDRKELIKTGRNPEHEMNVIHSWVRDLAQSYEARPVMVAYPLEFDFMFTHWYFMSYASKGDPFGFSNAIDMKTMFMVQSGNLLTRSTKRQMSDELKGNRRHTHNALDDAKGQADLFINLMSNSALTNA